ncbi:glycosyltransferase family 4 protein [Nocardioides sp. Root151]|uniref:glycosyltransferase family 4 protein n=1 Tax=Nocardioides sp. Root151 TaxID=1736475 RepID=UPI000702AE52|nr:glycosyltransferase family 4 protein [Nocardioides sp. Root151]KQZ67181.1 hypothetical protein ASD66_19555 [Nocardioides sp. Root151]
MTASRTTARLLLAARNLPIAASVVRRHLARGRGHTASIGARVLPGVAGPLTRLVTTSGRGPAYAEAQSAYAAGELSRAHEHATHAGRSGARLREHLAGELSVLTDPQTSAPERPLHPGTPEPTPSVLHLVTNSLPHSVAGYTTRTQGLLAAQRAAGTDARAATRIGYPVTRGHLAVPAVEYVDDVPYHRILTTVPLRADRALAKDVERTARLVERMRPAVLHAHSNHLNARVALALRERFDLPVVYEVRGFLEETERSRRGPDALPNERQRLTRAVETHCMREADAVLTISEVMREAIVARGIPAAKVHVVPNSVGDQFVAPGLDTLAGARYSTTEKQEARRSSAAEARGGVSRPVTVGAVGTLNDYEGLDVLIDAVALLPPGTARLLLVGDGPARTALQARACAAGIDAEFTGRVNPDRVVAQHQRIDIHATPRLDLPVTRLVPPIKPVEALALGRPVVASDLPPLRELVRDGHNGRLVRAGDAHALADVLAELAAAPDVRRRLGANGRADVLAHRTWERAAQTCARLYDEIRTGTCLIEGVTS